MYLLLTGRVLGDGRLINACGLCLGTKDSIVFMKTDRHFAAYDSANLSADS